MMTSFLKKLTFVFVISIVFMLMMWGTDPSNAGPSEKKPVKIGLLSPFSLPGDPSSGKRILWGAELAIKYINQEMGGVLGGRPVELVVGDDAGTPAEGVAGFRRLVQKDGVVAVMGQYHSSVCLAVNEVAKDLGIPLFATAAGSSKITETQYPTIFSSMNLIPDRGRAWLEFAKDMGLKRVATLAEDTDIGIGVGDFVEKHGPELGLTTKIVIFPRTITDLTPALLQIKAWSPDLLINIGIGPAGYLMVSQGYDIGLFPKVPILSGYEMAFKPEFWQVCGDKGKYILYTAYYIPGMKVTPLGEWVINGYKKLYKEDPAYYSLAAFGDVLVIAQAINLAKSDDPKAVRNALVEGTFTSWSGPAKFPEIPGYKWHNLPSPVLILQQTEVSQEASKAHFVWPPKFGGDGKIKKP